MDLVSRRAARREPVERVRPGAYVAAAQWDLAPERERHLLKVRAAARALTPRAVYSHESAAAVHGIPVLGSWPELVRASYDGSSGASTRAGVRWTRAHWRTGDVMSIAGMRVTSPRRTAVDLARTCSLAQGVIALDHVIAKGVDGEELMAWSRTQVSLHGAARLRRALGIAQGWSESPLESLSLARFAEIGVVMPTQQHEIEAGGRRYRVDFFWPEQGIAGEADGRFKYLSPEDLWREKRREDAIRATVRGLIRWSWSDAWNVSPLRDLLNAAGIPSV